MDKSDVNYYVFRKRYKDLLSKGFKEVPEYILNRDIKQRLTSKDIELLKKLNPDWEKAQGERKKSLGEPQPEPQPEPKEPLGEPKERTDITLLKLKKKNDLYFSHFIKHINDKMNINLSKKLKKYNTPMIYYIQYKNTILTFN